MEDLIFSKPSKNITFETEAVQNSLIGFENNLSSRQTNDYFFLINLYDLKKAWCDDVDRSGEFTVKFVKTNTLDSNKYFTFNQFMLRFFGLRREYVCKCIQVVQKFTNYRCCGAATPGFIYPGFTISKLFELLKVSDEQIRKDIKSGTLSCEMSCREIRDYVKSLKGTLVDNKVLENNTPEDKSSELPDLDKPCNVSLNIKRENLEYIKGLGVEIDSYINKLIEDDKSNRCID